jgi:hypothetical protein
MQVRCHTVVLATIVLSLPLSLLPDDDGEPHTCVRRRSTARKQGTERVPVLDTLLRGLGVDIQYCIQTLMK